MGGTRRAGSRRKSSTQAVSFEPWREWQESWRASTRASEAADVGSVLEDERVTLSVLSNDTDPEGGALRIASDVPIITQKKATVTVAPHGKSLTYVADADVFDLLMPGQTTTDTFTYTAKDEFGATSTATVTMTITGDPNDGKYITGSKTLTTLNGSQGAGSVSESEDTLTAANYVSKLYGYGGHDWLTGGTAGDLLDGGNGIDILSGGAGNDTSSAGVVRMSSCSSTPGAAPPPRWTRSMTSAARTVSGSRMA